MRKAQGLGPAATDSIYSTKWLEVFSPTVRIRSIYERMNGRAGVLVKKQDLFFVVVRNELSQLSLKGFRRFWTLRLLPSSGPQQSERQADQAYRLRHICWHGAINDRPRSTCPRMVD